MCYIIAAVEYKDRFVQGLSKEENKNQVLEGQTGVGKGILSSVFCSS